MQGYWSLWVPVLSHRFIEILSSVVGLEAR